MAREADLDDGQGLLLAPVRTKGFSIKYLDNVKREELRRFLALLHVEKGVSFNDVVTLVGNKTSCNTSWLYRQLRVTCRPFEEARLKGIRGNRSPSTGRMRTGRTCWG